MPLRVDLKDSDPVVEQVIRKKCFPLGNVRSVKIYRHPIAFALIEMAQADEVLKVAFAFGGSTFAYSALISLL
jgi:hypothetical protein